MRGGDTQRCRVRFLVSHHHATLWAVVGVVPPMQSTIKATRARQNRRAILVPSILRSSKNVLRSCRGRHQRVTPLNFRHVRHLAILAKESVGLMQSPSEMTWKRRLPKVGPGVPVGLATFGFLRCFWRRFRGRLGRSGCCPGKRRSVGFGHHVCDERAEKRKKYRDCLLIYRRVRGKKNWQLLPEHREALDRFEEHLEVSVRVFPCPLAVNLTDANIKRFM